MTRLSLWAPVILLKALIFFLSSLQDPAIPAAPGSDKAAHFFIYALLAASWVRALAAGSTASVTRRRVLAAVLVSALYGVLDEIHQLFVPGRMADWQDVAADAAGAIAGAVCAWLLARVWQRSKRLLA